MPELPEVETVRRGLQQILRLPGERILKIELSGKKLRYNPDLRELHQVKGERILRVNRLAKYLLFETDRFFLLSHLGMTGSWRLEVDQRKHDHIRIFLQDERILTYQDPRRFGFFKVFLKESLNDQSHFRNLGLDPVNDRSFNGAYLYQNSRRRKTSLKAFIMDQKIVVGVGNIYASEALYLAALHPKKAAESLTRPKAERLAESIKNILIDAIACGGTTISDFKQAGGSSGYFQNFLLVYGRDKEDCHFCGTMIRAQAIVGRNSFWCPSCQKL